MSEQPNIFPGFAPISGRDEKESLLKQHSRVIWLTGLSSSGKSTIAIGVDKELNKQGFFTQRLDGDAVRTGINKDLGFSDDDRKENIRRIAEVSKLLLNCGIITINSFVSPTKAIRELARSIIGEKDFIEVYINAPFAVCEQRDVKGLYKKARNGELKDFTGIDAPYESPDKPALEIRTHELSIEQSVKKVLDNILPLIRY